MKTAAAWNTEVTYRSQGLLHIVGLDEVGRGAWAGPILACAFAFTYIPASIEVFDSKLLSHKHRQTLVLQLKEFGVYGIGEANAEEIDTLGLQEAQCQSYLRAINSLSFEPDIILLDGHPWKTCPYKQQAIINGDCSVASISAGSIVAKVYRDIFMKEQAHQQYPDYGFSTHVGYGTKTHKQAIQDYGVSDIHRKSYKPIQAIVAGNKL